MCVSEGLQGKVAPTHLMIKKQNNKSLNYIRKRARNQRRKNKIWVICYCFRVPVSILVADFGLPANVTTLPYIKRIIIKPWKNKDINYFLKVLEREKCLDFSQKSQVEKAGFDNSILHHRFIIQGQWTKIITRSKCNNLCFVFVEF